MLNLTTKTAATHFYPADMEESFKVNGFSSEAGGRLFLLEPG